MAKIYLREDYPYSLGANHVIHLLILLCKGLQPCLMNDSHPFQHADSYCYCYCSISAVYHGEDEPMRSLGMNGTS
ncbi:hypothetical protein Bhyg_07860 [Pseudolycoriella hygida]|uniref:Uncharacterized protein n=1 Tax=Pseudolycoriella hygida TaxID=35572 RepID=A0A9Q0N3H7_9DIPT|nr:hypothetical protein Bhyg_07860 [Pseudolycoriella hygida]